MILAPQVVGNVTGKVIEEEDESVVGKVRGEGLLVCPRDNPDPEEDADEAQEFNDAIFSPTPSDDPPATPPMLDDDASDLTLSGCRGEAFSITRCMPAISSFSLSVAELLIKPSTVVVACTSWRSTKSPPTHPGPPVSTDGPVSKSRKSKSIASLMPKSEQISSRRLFWMRSLLYPACPMSSVSVSGCSLDGTAGYGLPP